MTSLFPKKRGNAFLTNSLVCGEPVRAIMAPTQVRVEQKDLKQQQIELCMSMMMMFPNGVEAVVITNCYKQDNGAMLRKALDASWYNPCE